VKVTYPVINPHRFPSSSGSEGTPLIRVLSSPLLFGGVPAILAHFERAAQSLARSKLL
jgi:hypothetical protein